MPVEVIENLINAYFTNMEAMNPSGWRKIFAQDSEIRDPVGNPPSNPHKDGKKFFGLLSSLFDKLELSKDNIFISGNGAAVKWTMKVVSKNGREASTQGISVFEINNSGKIQQVSSYWNEADLMAQLK